MEDNQPLNEKEFAKGLGQLFDSLVGAANAQREQSESYKDMFEAGKEGHEGLQVVNKFVKEMTSGSVEVPRLSEDAMRQCIENGQEKLAKKCELLS